MLLKEILRFTDDNTEDRNEAPTLEAIGITQEVLNGIDKWARSKTNYGKPASFIPELLKYDIKNTALAVGDLHGNILTAGNAPTFKASIQSVVKPFLYAYALEKGTPPDEISSIEATSLQFNIDKVLQPNSGITRPGHPLNNAGAISSAGAIENFNDFLEFMRELTGSPDLNIIEDIYLSESSTNYNNRAMMYRLVDTGRFRSATRGIKALDNYTKACSIGLNVSELVQAALVFASGGVKNGKRLISQNNVVRAINVMNSFGLYENTGALSLLASGTRALSCKSGVGGFIINIDPFRGASCSYNPLLDVSGNSVYGKLTLVVLNHLLSSAHAMRLDDQETLRLLSCEYEVSIDNKYFCYGYKAEKIDIDNPL